jgi:SAM-dependent methyltransferase
MVQDAQSTLADVERTIPFRYAKVDARAIPYPDASFDAVIANHMLYHVNNREEALAEIFRVLRPGGRIYASTIGSGHLREMKELLAEFDTSLVLAEKEFDQEFGLDNGEEQLAAAGFQDIEERRYDDALRVTQSEPLIAYIRSTTGNSSHSLSGARLARFKQHVEKRIRKEGYIGITKETGLFIGCKNKLEEDAK